MSELKQIDYLCELILKSVHELIVVTDRDQQIVFANQACYLLLGITASVLQASEVYRNIQHWLFIPKHLDVKQLSEQSVDRLEGFLKNIDGQLFPISFSKSKIVSEVQDPDVQWLYIFEDLSAQKLLESELSRRLSSLEVDPSLLSGTEFANLGLRKLHAVSTRKYENDEQLLRAYLQVGCELLGLEMGFVGHIDLKMGQYELLASFSERVIFKPGKKLGLNYTCFEWVLNRKKIVTYSAEKSEIGHWTHPAYQAVSVGSYIGIPIMIQDQVFGILDFSSTKVRTRPFGWESLKLVEMIAQTFAIILENRDMRQKLLRLSEEDALTGAYNRRKFDQILDHEISKLKRLNFDFSLVLIDIDFFKSINDQFGHDIGDQVLINLVKLISQFIRKTDILFRIGGEEFAILFYCELEKAQILSEELRIQVSEQPIFKDHWVSISLGLTQIHPDDTTQTFFKRADLALYRSKSNGRNQVQVEA